MDYSSPRRQPPPAAPPADAPKRNYWLALSVGPARAVGLLRARLNDATFVRVVALPEPSRCLAVVRLTRPARPGGVRARVGDACTHARHALLRDFVCAPRDASWGSPPRVGRPPRRAEPAAAAEPADEEPEPRTEAVVPRRWVLV